MAKIKRPSTVDVGDVHARVIRGPKDGAWYWQARVFRDGTDRTVYAGWATREQVIRELAGLVERNEVDKPREVKAAPILTVRDLLEAWAFAESARADIGAGAKRHYVTKCRPVARVIGDVRLDRIDLSTLERYRDTRLREPVVQARKVRKAPKGSGTGAVHVPGLAAPKGWEHVDTGRTSAPRTVAKELNMLAFAWRWGREMGYCPARDLPRVNVRVHGYVRNHSTPAREEADAVLDAVDGWRRTALLLLAATGGRIGEISELRWEDVDLAGATLTLRGKTGERVVPMLPDVVGFLRDLPRSDGATVVGVSPKVVRSHLRQWLADACDAAGVPRFTPHGLRRAVADAFLRDGIDVGTAAAFLGHSPQVMLAHYRKATLDDKRKALAKTRLGTITGGKVIAFQGQ